MSTMSNEQWAEEASIAYYESGAQYELDVCQEDWMERWLESKGRLGDGSPITEPKPEKANQEPKLHTQANQQQDR